MTPTPEPTVPDISGDDDLPSGDLEPEHTLLQSDEGVWNLSPAGGYPTALTGTLQVTESVDGSEDLSCEAVYSLTGTVEESDCTECEFAFRVRHTLVEGDPSACRRSDLPEDGAAWLLGYAVTEGGEFIYFDYYDTGVWKPWYDAARLEASVNFAWSQEVGVVLDDE